ncbi:MAG: ABC transporter substrate-binding protein [Betaproteobacteria bacterium]|nr:ABC transporter substrate-binding protein [Betaproteobacteria bacterium]MDH5220211.1 ABC transporter substrate-binding protein [Betaproteobacteria bacterium]MDH5350901.1 ABC transporter substrate-binding protein [Betaproteobacteria bacterium]
MGAIARRRFLAVAGGTLAALLAQIPARARNDRVYRVIWVVPESSERDSVRKVFVATMREHGWVEGRNFALEVLATERDGSDLPAVVDQALARKPDAFLAWESIAQVIRSRTKTVPIVLVGALDPVKAGLAVSLPRPGMNVTGIAQLNEQLPGKHMEILREILPRLRKVGQLVDRNSSGCRIAEAHSVGAALDLGCTLVPYYVSNRADIEEAFARMERDPPDALLPCPTPVLFAFRDLLFENVLRLRIPLTSYVVGNVPRGVLFAYAASLEDVYRQVAALVDKIFRGAYPGDLPIEQPTNFQLVVNAGTAKALGLAVPQSVLLRADRVID